jgi:hypothetical protein
VAAAPIALAPEATAGALSLFTLILWAIALGLAVAWRNTIGALFEHLADVMDRVQFHAFGVHVRPLAPFSGGLRDLDWLIQNVLDVTVKGCEHATVWLFHSMISLWEWTSHEIARVSESAAQTIWRVTEHTIPNATRRALHHTDTRVAHERHSRSAALARTDSHVSALRDDVHAIGHATTVALPREIGRIRTREGFLEREFGGIRSRLRSLEGNLGAAAFAGLVITALGRIGLRWLRCGNVGKVGRRLCGMDPSLLESLLLDALVIGSLASVVEFAKDLRSIEDEAVSVMGRIVREWPSG